MAFLAFQIFQRKIEREDMNDEENCKKKQIC